MSPCLGDKDASSSWYREGPSPVRVLWPISGEKGEVWVTFLLLRFSQTLHLKIFTVQRYHTWGSRVLNVIAIKDDTPRSSWYRQDREDNRMWKKVANTQSHVHSTCFDGGSGEKDKFPTKLIFYPNVHLECQFPFWSLSEKNEMSGTVGRSELRVGIKIPPEGFCCFLLAWFIDSFIENNISVDQPLSLWLLLSKTQVTVRCGGVSVNGFFCTREVSAGWNTPWHPTQIGNQFSGLSISGRLGVKSIKREKATWYDGCRVDSLANHTSFTPRGIGGSRRGLILRGWRVQRLGYHLSRVSTTCFSLSVSEVCRTESPSGLLLPQVCQAPCCCCR